MQFFETCQKIILKHGAFLFLFVLMNELTMAWRESLSKNDLSWHIVIQLAGLFLLGFLFVALCEKWVPEKIFSWVKKVILFVCFIPFCVELFVMYEYKALIGVGVLHSLLETNSHEAFEFCKMYVGWQEVILLCAIVGLCFLLKKFSLSNYVKNILATTCFIFSLCVFIPEIAAGQLPVYQFWNVSPVQRTAYASHAAYENVQAYKKLLAKVNHDVNITKNVGNIQNVVFILGESTNRNHMQLYGYYLPNNPRLMELYSRGELILFRDVVSPHSTTVAVLQKLFTFSHYENQEKPWHEFSNLIDILNVAGYRTFWLSNQESSGIWGSVAELFANRSTYHKFTQIRDSREDEGIEDDKILPLIDEAQEFIKEKHSTKNFFVLHLMGGHALYYNRYPYSFHKFEAKDIRLNLREGLRHVVATYDNALYFNDYVVREMIEKFRNEETILVYVPDHSEAVYDEDADGQVVGHIEENATRQMIEIPMMFWASPKFLENHADIWEKIKTASRENRPYMTDDFIHTMLDLMQIETKDYDATRSLINENFNPRRKRIFDGMDYDKEILKMHENATAK